MNILTLTVEQEKSLLTLCKRFFPEYKEVYITPINEGLGGVLLNSKTVVVEFCNNPPFGEGKSDFSIHWYQLCLTELPKRICNSDLSKRNSFPDILEMCKKHNDIVYSWENKTWYKHLQKSLLESEHPVDFLWDFVKEFKK